MQMDLANLVDRVEHWRSGRPEAEVIQFVEELFRSYLAASQDERPSLRQAVRANRDLWNVVGDDDICIYLAHLAKDTETRAVAYLRGWLIAVSLTGGCGDWRDTGMILDKLRKEAEAHGNSTETLFREIAATADSTNLHGVSGMSTCDLILAGGAIRDDVNLAGTSVASGPQSCPSHSIRARRRPWWQFWK